MQVAPRLMPLDRGIQASIVVAVLGAVLASGSLLDWVAFGRRLRWVGLLALVVLAAWSALSHGVRVRPLAPYALAAGFAVLCVLSAVWSADPASGIARGSAFAFVLAAAALLAAGGRARPALTGALAAVALVAFAGLALLVISPADAIGEATPREPARYSGIGGNPNTAPLVLSFGLPLAGAWLARAVSRAERVAAAVLLITCAASIAASGSRGALVAGFGGLAVTAAVGLEGPRRKVLAVGAVAVAALLAVTISELPQPDPNASVPRARGVGPAQTGGGYLNAEAYLALEDELGHPPLGATAPATAERSTLVGTSGRAQAWDWSVRHGLERPGLGYGFGAEDEAFVDRLSKFQGDTPENGYLGVFLQLGLVGAATFIALIASIALRTRSAPAAGWEAVGAAGAFAGGLLIALFQSYPYAAGGVGALLLWVCGFALVGLTAELVP